MTSLIVADHWGARVHGVKQRPEKRGGSHLHDRACELPMPYHDIGRRSGRDVEQPAGPKIQLDALHHKITTSN
ncbi:hypothetical protein [Methylobacterium gregans]|uniref:hypothetical protein n=1 Tax=Methylobacterium gregans TaxID=374424 RepID=UPI001EE1C475|nr:hypothetical protein [Methylobacterium gregans]MDQ0523082.1 hypothetical protein [Methylobacterium gregans]